MPRGTEDPALERLFFCGEDLPGVTACEMKGTRCRGSTRKH
jgi:hypothetical protein